MKRINFIKLINENIETNQEILNWSKDNKIRVPLYKFISANENRCILENPATGNKYYILEPDFQFMYDNWKNYKNKKISRHSLRDKNSKTTYTICILHFLEEKDLI